MQVYSKLWARYIAENTGSITVSTSKRMLKKQLIIVSSIAMHALKFYNKIIYYCLILITFIVQDYKVKDTKSIVYCLNQQIYCLVITITNFVLDLLLQRILLLSLETDV